MNRNLISFLKWFIPLLAVFASPFTFNYFSKFFDEREPGILWARHYSHEDLSKAEVCPNENMKGNKFYFYNKSKYSEKVVITTNQKALKVATNPVTALEITGNSDDFSIVTFESFPAKKKLVLLICTERWGINGVISSVNTKRKSYDSSLSSIEIRDRTNGSGFWKSLITFLHYYIFACLAVFFLQTKIKKTENSIKPDNNN